jgi:hypothetical protein
MLMFSTDGYGPLFRTSTGMLIRVEIDRPRRWTSTALTDRTAARKEHFGPCTALLESVRSNQASVKEQQCVSTARTKDTDLSAGGH